MVHVLLSGEDAEACGSEVQRIAHVLDGSFDVRPGGKVHPRRVARKHSTRRAGKPVDARWKVHDRIPDPVQVRDQAFRNAVCGAEVRDVPAGGERTHENQEGIQRFHAHDGHRVRVPLHILDPIGVLVLHVVRLGAFVRVAVFPEIILELHREAMAVGGERDIDEQGVVSGAQSEPEGCRTDSDFGRLDQPMIKTRHLDNGVLTGQVLSPSHVHADVRLDGDLIVGAARVRVSISAERLGVSRIIDVAVAIAGDAFVDEGVVEVIGPGGCRDLDPVQVGLPNIAVLDRRLGVDLARGMPPGLELSGVRCSVGAGLCTSVSPDDRT